jgi:hypothetical protein
MPYRAALVEAEAVVNLDDTSWISGMSCMIMISTQRPMAVSMVAGRVRKCGDVVEVRRSSDMADNSPEYDFFQNDGGDPK